jgi:hypothetical protein
MCKTHARHFSQLTCLLEVAQEEVKWQARVQASVKQAEESRQATLAANRRIGCLQAELAAAVNKADSESKGANQVSKALEDTKAEVYKMVAECDAKSRDLEEGKQREVRLQERLKQALELHHNDTVQAQLAEKELATQASGPTCGSVDLRVGDLWVTKRVDWLQLSAVGRPGKGTSEGKG